MNPTSKINWDFIDSHPMADKPDEESPELTDADFANMRPATEVLPEIFGATIAAEMLKPKISRLRTNTPKVFTKIRIDTDVLEAFRAKTKPMRLSHRSDVLKNFRVSKKNHIKIAMLPCKISNALKAFKATRMGWQARINNALKAWLSKRPVS